MNPLHSIAAILLTAAMAGAPPSLPAMSLYRIDGRFEDASAHKVGLDVARGKPVLLAMFYASCPKACPMLIADVQRVLHDVPDAERAEVRVVLVTLDPERDTPESLAKTMKTRGLDPARFTLLRADLSTTRMLAAALGVRWRDNEDGSIDHTSKIVLLDGDGVTRATRDAIGGPVDEFVARIRAEVAHRRP